MAIMIAGANRPELPRGDTVLLDIAFRPNRFADRAVWIYVPPSVGRFILNGRCQTVRAEGAKIWTTRASNRIPMGAVMVNRGCTVTVARRSDFNSPEACRIASDQVETLKLLAELAPKTVTMERADEIDDAIRLLGSDYVIGKMRHGQQGHGKKVMRFQRLNAMQPFERFDCFQVFFPRRAEYRLVMFRDTVLTAYRKESPPGTDPTNLHPLWHYYRIHEVKQSMVFMAQQAMQRVGLDVGGVDLIRDLDSKRLYCTEVNSAPGLGTPSVRALYAKLQEVTH